MLKISHKQFFALSTIALAIAACAPVEAVQEPTYVICDDAVSNCSDADEVNIEIEGM